jgi:carbamoyl-phosphate synthase large subunit
MKSTGEVMGIGVDLGIAFAKSQIAAGQTLPYSGNIFISVKDYDKPAIVEIARKFVDMNFTILSTPGTAKVLEGSNIPVTCMEKLTKGRPNILDHIKNREIVLLINTPSGPMPRRDEVAIRSAAVAYGIPLVTTIAGATAIANGVKSLKNSSFDVKPLQEIYSS